jgi:hypothetical protein
MRQVASVSGVPASCNRLPGSHRVASFHGNAVLLEVRIPGDGPIIMPNQEAIVVPTPQISILEALHDLDDLSAARRCDLSSDWHHEVHGDSIPVATTWVAV